MASDPSLQPYCRSFGNVHASYLGGRDCPLWSNLLYRDNSYLLSKVVNHLLQHGILLQANFQWIKPLLHQYRFDLLIYGSIFHLTRVKHFTFSLPVSSTPCFGASDMLFNNSKVPVTPSVNWSLWFRLASHLFTAFLRSLRPNFPSQEIFLARHISLSMLPSIVSSPVSSWSSTTEAFNCFRSWFVPSCVFGSPWRGLHSLPCWNISISFFSACIGPHSKSTQFSFLSQSCDELFLGAASPLEIDLDRDKYRFLNAANWQEVFLSDWGSNAIPVIDKSFYKRRLSWCDWLCLDTALMDTLAVVLSPNLLIPSPWIPMTPITGWDKARLFWKVNFPFRALNSSSFFCNCNCPSHLPALCKLNWVLWNSLSKPDICSRVWCVRVKSVGIIWKLLQIKIQAANDHQSVHLFWKHTSSICSA